MKATDFCEFFEFGIRKAKDEDGKDVYEVFDMQACFDSRFVYDIKDLIECFDSLEDDYIWRDVVESDGYEGEEDYSSLKAWIETKCKSLLESVLYEIVSAFASEGETIENDVELVA